MLRTCRSWSLLLLLGLSGSACSVDSEPAAEDAASSSQSERDASGSDGATEPDLDAAGEMDGATSNGRADGGMDANVLADASVGMDGASQDAACSGPNCDPCKLALYLVADLSGSMMNPVISGSAQIGDAGAWDAGSAADAGDAGDAGAPRPPSNERIEALRNALHAFVDDPATAGTQLGLGHYPHARASDAGNDCAPGTECGAGGSCCPGGDLCLQGFGCLGLVTSLPSCEVAEYAKPDVELGEPDASTLHTAISKLRAAGQSPTIVGLEGSLTYARTKLAPRHKVSVVLFADGAWNSCGPAPDGGMSAAEPMGGAVEPLVAVANRYATGASAVNTYVVAIKGDTDAGTAYFDPVADAGGTQQAYGASSADELLGALKAIRAHAAAACR